MQGAALAQTNQAPVVAAPQPKPAAVQPGHLPPLDIACAGNSKVHIIFISLCKHSRYQQGPTSKVLPDAWQCHTVVDMSCIMCIAQCPAVP